mmetsp:Transcript_57983/g.173056  ORF Transcript_57983/g.173056 Transcript_57983/m.173056 type:complete len:217 (-) Transcript_57983:194-844(-)
MTVLARLLVLAIVTSCLALPAVSFSLGHSALDFPGCGVIRRTHSRLLAAESSNADDDVARQLAKAKELLARAKAKLTDDEKTVEISLTSDDGVVKEKTAEVTSEEGESTSLPFFAQQNEENKRDMVTKSKDESTGLITVDGDKLAEISGDEEWEVRPLLEVFQKEVSEDMEDAIRRANKQLSERDVVASIWNLRKQLKTEDFDKIFDKRNRFIGEE